jgi:septation ring formation regulator EzrA
MDTPNFLSTQQQQTSDQNKTQSPFEKISQRVSMISSQLRVLEERYSNVRKKTQMTDQNLLDFEKEIKQETNGLSKDLLEIKRNLSDMNEKLTMMGSELQSTVKQSELKTVEKYVDLWQPLNFVTREEFKRYVKR